MAARPLRPDRLDAVPFDLDGVLPEAAGIHAGLWKRESDEFLTAHLAGGTSPEFEDDLAELLP